MTSREAPRLRKRAKSLLPIGAQYESDIPLTLRLIAEYAAQTPGLEYGNYCRGYGDDAGRKAYFSEARSITKDLVRVRQGLAAAFYAGATDADVEEATRHAFSGRLSILPGPKGSLVISYVTGQYWPTEYRKACAAVLEAAAEIARERQEVTC